MKKTKIIPECLKTYYHSTKIHIQKLKMMNDKSFLERLTQEIPRISLEPTNVCNANCNFCGYRYLKRKKGTMNMTLYESLVDELIKIDARELKFTPIVGDPLCDRNIIEKIEYAASKKYFSNIYMYTNLINLHLFDMDRLGNSGIDNIVISTCIANSEMYHRVFGVNSYEKVIHNIKSLISVNKKYGAPIDIEISLRNEKPAQIALDSLEYKELSAMGARISFMWDNYDNWLGLIRAEDLPKGNSFRRVKSIQVPCSQLYTGFIVGYDGKINICWCRDLDMELSIGRFPEVSLLEAWQGKKLRRLRENWKKGDIPGICQKCLLYSSVYDHPLLKDIYKEL